MGLCCQEPLPRESSGEMGPMTMHWGLMLCVLVTGTREFWLKCSGRQSLGRAGLSWTLRRDGIARGTADVRVHVRAPPGDRQCMAWADCSRPRGVYLPFNLNFGFLKICLFIYLSIYRHAV